MRSIWKGHISFSLVTIPVQIYSAVETSKSISFNQFHNKDKGRIGYEKKCKTCNKTVEQADIIKGYEFAKNDFVFFEDEEIKKLKIPTQKMIEIDGFVDQSEISPLFYEKPYYIAPDGKPAVKAYRLLVETIKETGKFPIARVSIRDKEDMAIISPLKDVLVMYNIRYPNEIRSVDDVPGITKEEINKKELDLAKSLVETMTKSLDDIQLTDRYQEALQELVNSKLEGREMPEAKEVQVKPVVDLMAALKESLNAKSVKKPMQKAKAPKVKAPATKKKTA